MNSHRCIFLENGSLSNKPAFASAVGVGLFCFLIKHAWLLKTTVMVYYSAISPRYLAGIIWN